MTAPQPMGELIDQYEAELIAKDKATTPEQRAAEEQRRQAQRDHEAKHTAIETDEERANLDEYPAEDETE
jgi:hypothetical protein